MIYGARSGMDKGAKDKCRGRMCAVACVYQNTRACALARGQLELVDSSKPACKCQSKHMALGP
jgi:hypothetical protein